MKNNIRILAVLLIASLVLMCMYVILNYYVK